ncbi:MAG: hypothetical protein EPN36_16835 [Rhodanobacteraceae bacterium]|nr:MAG: hypothetical protein EPN36_16835 [Rhodanobacteraceae bacterium]
MMKVECAQESKNARDLTRGTWPWLLWYLPTALLFASAAWPRDMAGLWVVAFTVMGAGCLANTARCGRLHCYITGPLFLVAAVWSLLSAMGVVPLHSGVVLLAVFGIVVLAHGAEVPFGRYTRAHREARHD